MDIKKITKELTKDMPRFKQHGQYQMCLGSLIKSLQRERVGLPIMLSSVYQGYEDKYPGLPHSYYGYPADLAFVPSTTSITVAQFLAVCETAIKASFVGPDHAEGYYRDYIMKANTTVWISELDKASKLGITDVVPVDGYIKLVTETMEEDDDVPG
tara:strand:- start:510 stop:977 length:468 start_codon:yes stop_codon:yes gene_type:complete